MSEVHAFSVWLVSDRPGRLAAWEMTHLRNLRLSCFGYGKAGMASMSAIEKEKQRFHKCISRESNPGHIDGNDVFYHETTDAADQEFSGREFDTSQQDMEEEFSRSAEAMDFPL